jgi:hypothetical protein
MARFYGLPNSQQGCLTDAKEPGAQAVMEKMITTLPLVLGGADLIEGTGALDMSAMLSLEQIVVDDEIAGLCKRLRDGVDVRRQTAGHPCISPSPPPVTRGADLRRASHLRDVVPVDQALEHGHAGAESGKAGGEARVAKCGVDQVGSL